MLVCSIAAQIPVQNIQKFAYGGPSGERVGSQCLQRLVVILLPAVLNDRADIPLDTAEVYVIVVGHSGKDHLPREEKEIFIIQSKFQGDSEIAEAFVFLRMLRSMGRDFNLFITIDLLC